MILTIVFDKINYNFCFWAILVMSQVHWRCGNSSKTFLFFQNDDDEAKFWPMCEFWYQKWTNLSKWDKFSFPTMIELGFELSSVSGESMLFLLNFWWSTLFNLSKEFSSLELIMAPKSRLISNYKIYVSWGVFELFFESIPSHCILRTQLKYFYAVCMYCVVMDRWINERSFGIAFEVN